MNLIEKKNSFVQLGQFLGQFASKNSCPDATVLHNQLFFDDFENLIKLQQSYNGWFTEDQVRYAIANWAQALTAENIEKWLMPYELTLPQNPQTVGLILAGNIPLVGFHDFLSVLISGHKALIKLSSNDKTLLPFLAKYLQTIHPNWTQLIAFETEKMPAFDAIIATGSDNTARYFEYYFKNKPHIIRKNRNSVAVLDGSESKEDLAQLGVDIFTHFGLGCRSVSKLLVPKKYDFSLFFEAIFPFGEIIYYEKYANNYDYNKAVFLMSQFQLLDNEFLLLKEDSSYASPIGSLFYEYYEDINAVVQQLQTDAPQIQCVVSAKKVVPNSIAFGQTQQPQLWDYADNVDTISFLQTLQS